MCTKLNDNEVVQHILDLHNSPLPDDDFAAYHQVKSPEGDECVHRFIRTFGDKDMREDAEAFQNLSQQNWLVVSPGCPENCHCRN